LRGAQYFGQREPSSADRSMNLVGRLFADSDALSRCGLYARPRTFGRANKPSSGKKVSDWKGGPLGKRSRNDEVNHIDRFAKN
jgi:hypothetical protein